MSQKKDFISGRKAITYLDLFASGNGDTYSFKIKKKGMPLLFPESIIYNI